MKIFKNWKKDFAYGSFKKIRWGTYTANKTLLFFLICIVFVCIMFGKSLNNVSVQIKNEYLRKIYLACTAPFVEFSSKHKIDLIIPEARAKFLQVSKLENHTEWDNFYYTELEDSNENTELSSQTENTSDQNKLILDKVEEKKKDIDELNTDIKELEDQLAVLNKKIAELKSMKKEDANVESFKDKVMKKNQEKEQEEQTKVTDKDKSKKVQNTKVITLNKDATKANTEKEKAGKEKLALATKKKSPKQKEKKEQKVFEYTKKKPLRVLMVGDSQMTSIAGGFMRIVGQNAPIKITKFSVHSSGFIRGDYYNWQKKLKNIFSKGKYDVAIILLGMNDYQNFYNDNGKVLVKETKAWENEYHARIKKHLDILQANTKKVYWLGMPKVRNQAYNEELQYIEKIQKRLADKYPKASLTRFAVANVAPGKGVPYSDIIRSSDGSIIKLMRDDGTHYTISGGAYIMQSFMNLLYQEWSIEPLKK